MLACYIVVILICNSVHLILRNFLRAKLLPLKLAFILLWLKRHLWLNFVNKLRPCFKNFHCMLFLLFNLPILVDANWIIFCAIQFLPTIYNLLMYRVVLLVNLICVQTIKRWKLVLILIFRQRFYHLCTKAQISISLRRNYLKVLSRLQH